MAGIGDDLAQHEVICLDTAPWIYLLERNPRYLLLTQEILRQVESRRCSAVSSVISLMEIGVRPIQIGRSAVARGYETLLLNFPGLSIYDVDRHIARTAARLRAQYRVRPADALVAATGLVNNATLLVTNDRGLMRLSKELQVLLLDDHL